MIHVYRISRVHFHSRAAIWFFVTMAVASTSTSVTPENLPVRCENCTICYGDFCYLYTAYTEKLLKYCQDHGVILAEKHCASCNSVCRVDINKLCLLHRALVYCLF